MCCDATISAMMWCVCCQPHTRLHSRCLLQLDILTYAYHVADAALLTLCGRRHAYLLLRQVLGWCIPISMSLAILIWVRALSRMARPDALVYAMLSIVCLYTASELLICHNCSRLLPRRTSRYTPTTRLMPY